MTYTVNCLGDIVAEARANGYHAYHANGVTAVEIPANDKRAARRKAKACGWHVLYVFE